MDLMLLDFFIAVGLLVLSLEEAEAERAPRGEFGDPVALAVREDGEETIRVRCLRSSFPLSLRRGSGEPLRNLCFDVSVANGERVGRPALLVAALLGFGGARRS